MLYKCNPHKRTEVFPGCFIEKKSLKKLIDELEGGGKNVFALEPKGENIRNLDNDKLDNSAFLIGDQEGLPAKEIKKLDKISVGRETYFASQTIVIINNEMDFRGL